MAEFKVFGEPEKSEPKENTGKKSNKITRLFKKKPFLIAVAVVVVLGLIAWYKKSQNPVTTDTGSGEIGLMSADLVYPSTDAYMSSEGNYFTDVLDGLIGTMDDLQTQHENELLKVQDSFTAEVESIRHSFDVIVDDMSSQIYSLSDKLDTQSDTLSQQSYTIARQNDIQAMQENSDAWHYATSDAERQALQKANEEIASKHGWTRGNDGLWYEGGTPVYQTTTQKVVTSSAPASKNLSSSGGSGSSKSQSSTQSDIATMKANSQAWHTASDSQKKALNEANKAIAQKNGWTFNSASGTHHDKAGNRVY